MKETLVFPMIYYILMQTGYLRITQFRQNLFALGSRRLNVTNHVERT